MNFWRLLSAFGDPYLTLPLAGIIMVWLATTGRRRIAVAWTTFFCIAALIVGVTKFAYAGWGLEISPLHFTVISGHTMLSSAVYPLAFYLCAHSAGERTARWAARGGLGFAVLIGVSRVMVGAHSTSEVVVGLLLGSVVSTVLVRALDRNGHTLASSLRFVSACAITTFACYGHAAPIQAWIVDTAPRLSHLLTQHL